MPRLDINNIISRASSSALHLYTFTNCNLIYRSHSTWGKEEMKTSNASRPVRGTSLKPATRVSMQELDVDPEP